LITGKIKSEMKKATDYISSKYGNAVDVPIVFCLPSESGNGYELYSNKRLSGYSSNGGIFKKELCDDELSEGQRQRLRRCIVNGSRQISAKENESDAAIFGMTPENYSFSDDYVFFPVSPVNSYESGSVSENSRVIEYLNSSIPSTLVHEIGHVIGQKVKKRLAKRLGTGKGDINIINRKCYLNPDGSIGIEQEEDFLMTRKDHSINCQQEAIAYMHEMEYLSKSEPDKYKLRKEMLRDDIKRDFNDRITNPDYPCKVLDPNGPDEHPSGAKLYFKTEENTRLKNDIGKILKSAM